MLKILGSSWIFVVVGLLLMLVCPNSVLADIQYSLFDLGPLAGNDAYGINDHGQVVGAKTFAAGFHGFLYSAGNMTDLGTLSSDQTSIAFRINNSGQIVGTSQQSNGGGSSRPFIYSGGVMTEIPGLGGSNYGSANGINSSGQVVGISARPDTYLHAFLFSGGVTTDLGTLTGNVGYSDAYGINNSGQVVGISTVNGRGRGFIWQNGTMSDIGDLSGGNGTTAAYRINNLGQVVGETYLNAQSSRAFVWQDGLMVDIGPGTAEAINDKGVVIGANSSGLFVWDKLSGMRDVMSLLDSSGAGWTLYGGRDINIAGQITGWGLNPDGQVHGYVLVAVPEPSSILMAMVGIASLFGWNLKRDPRATRTEAQNRK